MNAIQAIITVVPSQRPRVNRLVKYCKDLDGTEVRIIEIDDSKFSTKYKDNSFPNRQAYSMRCAALELKGKSFFWLEPDSIPLQPGWLKKITEAHVKSGKHFTLSSDSNPPHDLVGGIGIYGPDTNWLLPKEYQRSSWDLWMINNLRSMIHFTTLVQHSYGVYTPRGYADEHRFPRDKAIIRPSTQIFHRDKNQDLLTLGQAQGVSSIPIFFHSGDLGDIIAALPVVRQLGGGCLYLGKTQFPPGVMGNRESIDLARYDVVAPLLLAQPYLRGVSYVQAKNAAVDYDFSTFRKGEIRGENLTVWQARHLGLQSVDMSPWLAVNPSPVTKGKVVIARSSRYHNPSFNWPEVLRQNKAVFVGLQAEHAEFQRKYGPVEYIQTKNLLQLAELIAGSDKFVGNQSCPAWIAMGLGVPILLEGCPHTKNTHIDRENFEVMYEKLQGGKKAPKITQPAAQSALVIPQPAVDKIHYTKPRAAVDKIHYTKPRAAVPLYSC